MDPEVFGRYDGGASGGCGKDNRNRGQEIAATAEEKRMIYNCEKEILYPPKKFIPYNSTPGEYKESIRVDKCIAKEIEHLWSLGVVTLGCCCGHGRHLGFINVDEKSVPLMKIIFLRKNLVERKEKTLSFQKVTDTSITDIRTDFRDKKGEKSYGVKRN